MTKLSFSYHISANLNASLKQIDILRRDILLTPIPPRIELRYRWDALVDKIRWSLSLDGESLDKTEIASIMINLNRKKLSPLEKDVYRYRYAFEYLFREWLGSKKSITVKAVVYLHDLIGRGKIKEETAIKNILDYLEAGTEHPILQASIAHIELIGAAPFTQGNGQSARLLSYIFLYKQGYDMHGMLVLEEYFKRNKKMHDELATQAIANGNITPWLEYAANGVVTQLMHLKKKIIDQTQSATKLLDLTERQQTILSFLEQPGSRITNKKCKTLFGISQITSSRELAKLVALGVIFPHGKGRSVFYTKV